MFFLLHVVSKEESEGLERCREEIGGTKVGRTRKLAIGYLYLAQHARPELRSILSLDASSIEDSTRPKFRIPIKTVSSPPADI